MAVRKKRLGRNDKKPEKDTDFPKVELEFICE